MTNTRHTSGPLKGKFMSKAEANLAYTAAGTYASRPTPTAEQIEQALARIAPAASSVSGIPAADTGTTFYGQDSSPNALYRTGKVTPQEDSWAWTKAALDVAGGAVVMTGVVCFGIGVYYAAHDILPKLIPWLYPL